MSSRFVRIISTEEMLIRFKAVDLAGTFKESFNIAPGNKVSVVINEGGQHKIESFLWGIVPPWSKTTKSIKEIINVSVKSLKEKPFFTDSLKYRRCLVIANGFYEWKKDSEQAPAYFSMKNDEVFAFAGIFVESDVWRQKNTKTLALITVEANDLVKPYHNRMPAIVPKPNESFWLDSSNTNSDILTNILRPYPFYMMKSHKVSSRVNFIENDDAVCVAPLQEKPEPQLKLKF